MLAGPSEISSGFLFFGLFFFFLLHLGSLRDLCSPTHILGSESAESYWTTREFPKFEFLIQGLAPGALVQVGACYC